MERLTSMTECNDLIGMLFRRLKGVLLANDTNYAECEQYNTRLQVFRAINLDK